MQDPIKHKVNANRKAYLAVYACSLTHGVYLELLHSLETEEFMRCLKRFIARRGRQKVIYSDNGTTFKVAAELIKRINNNDRFHNYLATGGVDSLKD